MLFSMCIKPLPASIDSYCIMHYSLADDLQLYMSALPNKISTLLHPMLSCMSYIKAWAVENMLTFNYIKAEFVLVISKSANRLHNLPTSITFGNAQIPFMQSVKNLSFSLDCHLTMNPHISNIAWTCYFDLRFFLHLFVHS